jgi:hypothetical protein
VVDARACGEHVIYKLDNGSPATAFINECAACSYGYYRGLHHGADLFYPFRVLRKQGVIEGKIFLNFNQVKKMQDIKILTFHRITDTNSYLVKTNNSYVLIDTGYSTNRKELEKQLAESGCTPGNLKLILITHGHFDHTGNCAFLREKYGAPIAMHKGD